MRNSDPFLIDVAGQGQTTHSHSTARHDISYVPGEQSGAVLLILNTEKNMRRLFVVFGLVLAVMGGRLVQLQIFQGTDFRLHADTNRIRTLTSAAPRGAILDRYGKVLADNIPNLALTVTASDLPTDETARAKAIEKISQVSQIDVATIKELLQAKKRRINDPVNILENIPYDQAMKLIISLADTPAVAVAAIPNRNYPAGETFAAVLGYTSKISAEELLQQPYRDSQGLVGKVGLEKQYNQELTGIDGIKSVERDVRNSEQRIISQRDAEPGNSIVTTLDADLQQRLYQKLRDAVESMHSPGGAAIAIDPRNGEILALTSAPTFDDNWFVKSGYSQEISNALSSPSKTLLNRAISGQYPSGSIIKPLISSAALAERTITPSTTVMSTGGFKVGSNFFPDWKAGGHGLTNVTKAIAESVNTFFYAIGGGLDNITGLGVDRIVTYLQKFGWGSLTGIDLPAEASGLLPTKEWRTNNRPSPWKLGDTYHLSIGQGDLEVTPLQVATSMSTIANGGTLYRPHILKEVRQANGQTISTVQPEKIDSQVVPTSVVATVRSGMREGVLSGSSRLLQSLPVTSGAKTGTAQFGIENKTHAWFTVFAPYDNPIIAITVLVEAGGEGNATALPIAKDALQWYFTEGAGKPQ